MKTVILNWLKWTLAGVALTLPLGAAAQDAGKPFSNEQLDQMMAQVALYPDALLSQLLMAATYPDEFQEAARWSKAHPDAKGDDAVKQVESNDWDPSVASMVAFPEVLITLGDKPDYVKNMGDAFLAQPEDVMNSVQRLRAGAQKAGNLKSNEQIKVSTEPLQAPAPAVTVVQAPPVTQTIVIEPAQPSVVYVPAYNPTAVYGPWWYPTPPYYYPPPPGYWFSRTVATGIAWGVGIGVSNALWGGVNWGRGDVDINVNRYNNINVNKQINANGNRANWNHDSGHRKTDYRGGNAQRQNLDRKTQAAGREQYRGKDASRDASRANAQAAMQQRGVDPGSGSARERAQNVDRDAARQKAQGADRGAMQDRAQNVDRDAARRKAAGTDRDAARQRAQQASHDNAFKGAGDRQARQQADRGAASERAAQRSGGGGGGGAAAQRASGGGGGASAQRASGGGGGGRPAGGGGGRGGGGGGRGR